MTMSNDVTLITVITVTEDQLQIEYEIWSFQAEKFNRGAVGENCASRIQSNV